MAAREDTHPPLTGLGAPQARDARAELAIEAYLAAVEAVDPTRIVRKAVRAGKLDDWLGNLERPKQIHVLALGKAAPRMLWGLVEAAVPFVGVGVAPRGVPMPGVDTFRWLVGDHPIPGDASFAAGAAVVEWLQGLPRDAPLLVLLSGGTSACIEGPAPGVTREAIAELNRRLVTSGESIEGMNAQRAALSTVKAGGLARIAQQRTQRIRVWILADTEPASAARVVGSGPFWTSPALQGAAGATPEPGSPIPHDVLASSEELAAAAGAYLASRGRSVFRHGRRIAGPATRELIAFIGAARTLPAGAVLVGAGEADVAVPSDGRSRGGRCHHAALEAARQMREAGIDGVFLAGASDGVDGSSGASAAWARAGDWSPEAQAALDRFDAAPWLDSRGQSVSLGPTGTNVNDVWVLMRSL